MSHNSWDITAKSCLLWPPRASNYYIPTSTPLYYSRVSEQPLIVAIWALSQCGHYKQSPLTCKICHLPNKELDSKQCSVKTWLMVNWGICKSDINWTGCFWYHSKSNSLVVLETNLNICTSIELIQKKSQVILTGCNFHGANLSIQWIFV